jgi:hypothetical protein
MTSLVEAYASKRMTSVVEAYAGKRMTSMVEVYAGKKNDLCGSGLCRQKE